MIGRPLQPTLGHHTLGIECKDVLPALVYKLLIGNRIGVGLMLSTIISLCVFYPQLREKVDNVRRVVNLIDVERAKSADSS